MYMPTMATPPTITQELTKVMCVAHGVFFAFLYALFGIETAAITVAATAALVYYAGVHPYYEKKDLPGPPPTWFFGNLDDCYVEGQHETHTRWIHQYGDVFRFWAGHRDNVVIADLDLIHQICVKDFAKAADRPSPARVRDATGLLFAKGDFWRRIRRSVAPTFATKYLRQFSQKMNDAASTAVVKMNTSATRGTGENGVEFWDFIGRTTMEVIGSTAFGVKFDSQNDPDDKLTDYAARVFAMAGAHKSKISVYMAAFPWLVKVFVAMKVPRTVSLLHALHQLDATSMGIIHERRANPDRPNQGENATDFVEFLMGITDKETGLCLKDNEIRDQANTFLLAGYETTSNCVTFTTYLLALSENAAARRRLTEEIDRLAPADGFVSYDDLKNYTYVEAVVSESLRLFPPGAHITREVTEDFTLANGLALRTGQAIWFPTYAIHRDERYWPEPTKFKPERFIRGEGSTGVPPHPCAYLPFGIGPRNCIGSRFALEEAKLLVIRMFREFEFELDPKFHNENAPLPLRQGITLSPADGLHLKVTRRSR